MRENIDKVTNILQLCLIGLENFASFCNAIFAIWACFFFYFDNLKEVHDGYLTKPWR